MEAERRGRVLFSLIFMLSITACTSPAPSESAPRKTSESALGDGCTEYRKAAEATKARRQRADSEFFQLVASGNGDPVIEARRALAAGDVRFVAFSPFAPGITPAAYGVECRPAVRFDGQGPFRAVVTGSDVIGTEEEMQAQRRVEGNFEQFGTLYNATLLSDPHYPYRDICRPSPPGYRPHASGTAPAPGEYGFRDLVPTEHPVDLGEAARRGTLESMEKLIRSDKAALARADAFGMTPLAWAIAYRREPHIASLLSAGADPAGATCSRMSSPTSPMQIARSLRWRSLILKMRPMVPAARAERLFDKPVPDLAYRANFGDLGIPLAHRTVGIRLSVNAKGRTQACTVTSSSGDPGVDRGVCAASMRRWRWLPARGEFGEPVAGDVDQIFRGV